MPFGQVMSKFRGGNLHSGSKTGPKVKNRKQAVAIMLSEKRKAQSGDKPEYAGDKKDEKKRFGKKSRGGFAALG